MLYYRDQEPHQMVNMRDDAQKLIVDLNAGKQFIIASKVYWDTFVMCGCPLTTMAVNADRGMPEFEDLDNASVFEYLREHYGDWSANDAEKTRTEFHIKWDEDKYASVIDMMLDIVNVMNRRLAYDPANG